jgi:hypothetical protein
MLLPKRLSSSLPSRSYVCHPLVHRSPYRSPFRSTVTEITKIEARQPSGNLAEEGGPPGSATSTPTTAEPLPPVSEVGATIQGLERAGIGESPLQPVDALRHLLHCCWPSLQAVWLHGAHGRKQC